ncbi:MAG: hypothetical protein HYS89_02150 [Candidatus Colwellbacteria bacterium]|nr:hypothetical protein [Candidatus Colwellbacteria bacterium]
MIEEIFESGIESVLSFWWFIIPVTIAVIFREWWLTDITRAYIRSIKWVLLEIKIPRENLKSAKAMEQVFANLYQITYPPGRKDRYTKGKVENWMSFEMVGEASGVRFFVRAPAEFRKLVEASFFSQYPEAELEEVPDYINEIAPNLPNEKLQLFGTDLILAREDAYPIKTYPTFEASTEEELVDPIGVIIEAVANLRGDERLLSQLLIRPVSDDWVKKGKEVVDKVSGRKKEEKKDRFGSTSQFLKNFMVALVKEPEWGAGGDKPAEPPPRTTPGEQDALKAVENKLSKLGFEALWRMVYIDNRDAFTGENVDAFFGATRHFNTYNLNSIKPNFLTMTSAYFIAKPFRITKKMRQVRLERRRKFIWLHYVNRDIPQPVPLRFGLELKTSVFNTEELATLFHVPTTAVTPARVRALEARKGEAPINLPVIEE